MPVCQKAKIDFDPGVGGPEHAMCDLDISDTDASKGLSLTINVVPGMLGYFMVGDAAWSFRPDLCEVRSLNGPLEFRSCATSRFSDNCEACYS